ncbi:hypothetical protein RB213_014344 [Colletotrichum asianum]
MVPSLPSLVVDSAANSFTTDVAPNKHRFRVMLLPHNTQILRMAPDQALGGISSELSGHADRCSSRI